MNVHPSTESTVFTTNVRNLIYFQIGSFINKIVFMHLPKSFPKSPTHHVSGKRRYNIKLWKTFTDCFNCLPVAAIVDEKIFCCHGKYYKYGILSLIDDEYII